MGFPISGGWWGFVGTLVAGYLLGQFTNLTTPLVRYILGFCAKFSIRWFATRTRASLERKIGTLQAKLSEAEKYPPLDPVQNQILWEIKSVKIAVVSVSAAIVVMIGFGITAVAKSDARLLEGFSELTLIIAISSVVITYFLRYQKDFRWVRQAGYRESLGKTIKELEELREKWDADMPDTKPQ